MTLPIWTTNPYTLLTVSNIEAEFGGNAPTNLSEYYAGSPTGFVANNKFGYPRDVETPIPSSGALAVSNFYGSSKIPYTIITDKETYDEGEVITFTVTAPDRDETQLYWTIEDSTVTINISPQTLPNVSINSPYPSINLSSTGGTGPYSYNVVYGALPQGLDLRANGFLVGTPTSIGTSFFAITSTDANVNSGTKQYSITVEEVNIVVDPTSLPTGVINIPYQSTIFVANGGTPPYTYSVSSGNLPIGMTLTDNVISGTPTVAGTSIFQIEAKDVNQNVGYKSYNLSVEEVNISFSPNALPDAYTRIPYTSSITASGGTPPYQYSIISGALPDGIALDANTGNITGNTTQVGSFIISLQATDANLNISQRTYTVTSYPVTLTIDPPMLVKGSKNIYYETTFETTGNRGQEPYTYTVATGFLPNGIVLSGNTISGTPTTVETKNFAIKSVDANGNFVQQNYALEIDEVVIIINPETLPRAIQNEYYGEPLEAEGGSLLTPSGLVGVYTWSVVDSLPDGMELSSSGFLSGIPTGFGNKTFSVKVEDVVGNYGIKTYNLLILSSTWDIQARTYGVAPIFVNEGNIITFDVTAPSTVSGNLISQLVIGAPITTNGQDTYRASSNVVIYDYFGTANIKINSDYLTEDAEYFNVWVEYPPGTVVVNYGNINVNDTSQTPTIGSGGNITLNPTEPAITIAYLPFSFTLSATGGTAPYTFSQADGTLPTGLTFYTANSTVAGIPTTPVTNRAVVFTGTDATGLTGYNTYNFNVNAPTIQITPLTLAQGSVGEPYTVTFEATGGTAPYTFTTTGNIASGFNLLGNVLSGTASTIDSATFTLIARDANNFTASQTYTQTFTTLNIAISPMTIPTAWKDNPYNQQLSVSGGAAPYTFNIDPNGGSMPPGLSCSNTGLISGTPTSTGSYTFKVVVTDRYGDTGEINYTVNVQQITLTGPSNVPWTANIFYDTTSGFQYSTTITASGGSAPYTFSLISGNMPNGWALLKTSATTASVSGRTNGAGDYTFTIKVTDTLGRFTTFTSTVFVFALQRPTFLENLYDIRTMPNADIDPSTAYSLTQPGNKINAGVDFNSDGTWNLWYNNTSGGRSNYESGTWYSGTVPTGHGGLSTTGDSYEFTYATVQEVVPGGGSPNYWTSTPYVDTKEFLFRLYWDQRANTAEEYIVKVKFTT